jgi:hypothetical protein
MTVKKWNVWLSIALVLCASLLPALAEKSPEVLGILEIRGLEGLSASASELTRAAGSPMSSEMISMTLHQALGTMPGTGLQPEGTVRALWFENGTEQGGVALLLPVDNEGTNYLASLGQAGWKNDSEPADGIEHFIPPAGAGVAWPEVYFLKRGSTLIACRNAADVRQAETAMPNLPPILPVEGDVALQLRPAALVEAFGPQIAEQMDQAFAAKPGAPEGAAAMGQFYARGYIAVAKQLGEFTLGLGVADGSLNFHTRLAPVAGSTLEAWLSTMRPPSAAAAVVNLPGALFAETVHMGDLNLIAPAYFRYVEELMKLMPQSSDPDFAKGYMENVKTYWAQISGDLGVALLPPTKESPIRAAEYVALKDSSALRALTAQLVQSENEMIQAAMAMSEAGQPAPFKFELTPGEARDYREIPVDRLTYRLTLGDSIKEIWPKGLPTELPIEMAWIPGGVLVSVGDAALTDALVDRALDGIASPVSDLPSWTACYPTPETNLVDIAHASLFDAIRAYAELVDSYTGGSAARSIPAGPGNLDSLSYADMGGVMNRLRFSLADIGAAALKIKEAQQKAMAERMQMMQQRHALSGAPEVEEAGEAAEAPSEEPAAPPAEQAPVPTPATAK